MSHLPRRRFLTLGGLVPLFTLGGLSALLGGRARASPRPIAPAIGAIVGLCSVDGDLLITGTHPAPAWVEWGHRFVSSNVPTLMPDGITVSHGLITELYIRVTPNAPDCETIMACLDLMVPRPAGSRRVKRAETMRPADRTFGLSVVDVWIR